MENEEEKGEESFDEFIERTFDMGKPQSEEQEEMKSILKGGYSDKYNDVLEEIDPTEVTVDDDDVNPNWERKILWTGKSYSANLPIELVRMTNIAKGDGILWSFIKDEHDVVELRCTIYKDGFRVPVEDRTGGR